MNTQHLIETARELVADDKGLLAMDESNPAKEAGALSIQVKDPEETKRVIEVITACLTGVLPIKPLEVPHR